MANRLSGPADNQSFFNHWIKTDPTFNILFVSAVNYPPFHDQFDLPEVPSMTAIVWAGRVLHVKHQATDDLVSEARVGAWGDLLAPEVMVNRIPRQADARLIYLDAMNSLLVSRYYPQVSRVAMITLKAFIAAYRRAEQVREDYRAMEAFGITDVDIQAGALLDPRFNTFEEAIAGTYVIYSDATEAFKIGGASMIVNVLCSVLRRGNLSIKFTTKVAGGMADDLDMPGIDINPLVCKRFFSMFGAEISAANIRAIVDKWLGQVPQAALRLRLTLEQAAGTGLTTYIIIGRAIRLYPDFDWQRVSNLLAPEMLNYIQALLVVNGNVWYGYNNDLGPVKSTNYKNLGYVAKELLVKVNSESSLNQYLGWPKTCKYMDVVTLMIAEFLAYRAELAMLNPGDEAPVYRILPRSEATAGCIETCSGEVNVVLFA